MYKQILTAASLALWLAGPAAADYRERSRLVLEPKVLHAEIKTRRDENLDRSYWGRDRQDRDRDHEHGDWCDHDRDDWRRHDRDRDDWRDHDWHRDEDWRRRGWHYQGWRSDGWRYYRGHDHRQWRYVPPYRFGLDLGYRSGYELAWRDWLNYGRHDRYWRRTAFHGYGSGYSYRSGYDAGWRDAALYYGRGYRPAYWSYDPYGGWYFGFSVSG